jgi:hypothetical protein
LDNQPDSGGHMELLGANQVSEMTGVHAPMTPAAHPAAFDHRPRRQGGPATG